MRKAWIYRRPDTGKYDVYYWQGKRRTWAGGIESKRLATQALNICIQRINTAVFGNSVTVDLQTALDEYLKKYKLENAAGSHAKTKRALDSFFAYAGRHKLADYGNSHFLDYAESRQKKVTDSTVRYDLITARSFFRYCKESGYIESVPDIPNIQPSYTKQGGPVSIDEFVRFCGVADPDTRLSAVVGLVTGLRTMDVRNLTDKNIAGQYIETVAQKTGKKVRAYLPPILRDMLKGFTGFEKLTQWGFQYRMNLYASGWTFHDLRRTHAQLIRDFDSSLIFARDSLQHSNVKVTRDFYATSNAILIEKIFTPILERLCEAGA